jgi:NAD(P)-dependent dehydrogenase (short-subunit alcohol dehydrogenase family)
LDVLVNNAASNPPQVLVDLTNGFQGIMDRFDAVGECDFKMWEKVLAVNLTGPFIMTKLAVNHFLSREAKGKILNIGSLSSFRGHTAGKLFPAHDSTHLISLTFSPGVAYTASKHGLLGLTKNTAAAYGKNGIRCNILMPAGMATNIGTAFATTGMNMDRFQKVQALMAAGEAQMVDTAQLAKTAVFLCSDNAQALNGAEIVADHGFCSN